MSSIGNWIFVASSLFCDDEEDEDEEEEEVPDAEAKEEAEAVAVAVADTCLSFLMLFDN